MELDLGEIYLLQNKLNKKCYVGQACCYTGKENKKWGSKNRWKSHIREAYSDKKDHCQLLNQAIRKYDVDNFELKVLGKYHLTKLNEMEPYFIKEYNSLVPNGYNLNEGGSRGKDSAETILKKRLMRLGKKNSKEHVENSRIGQIGNRRKAKKRKYKEDENLPKYITAVRRKKQIIGYGIYKYPIGINEKQYISFDFTSTKILPEKNLELTLNKLEELKKEYAYIEEEIKNKNEELKKIKIQEKMQNSKKLKKLPEYIERIFTETGKIKGYKVKYKNKSIQKYTGKTDRWNYNDAKKYIKLSEIEDKDEKFTIPQLPQYVYTVKNRDKTKITGFEISYRYDTVKNRYQKKITHPLFTLEEKYKKILNELDIFKNTLINGSG